MIKRAQCAKELGLPIIARLHYWWFHCKHFFSMYCRDHGLLLHIHRAMHAVIDRQRNHGIHFRVLAGSPYVWR